MSKLLVILATLAVVLCAAFAEEAQKETDLQSAEGVYHGYGYGHGYGYRAGYGYGYPSYGQYGNGYGHGYAAPYYTYNNYGYAARPYYGHYNPRYYW